jgi:hypothetical protein
MELGELEEKYISEPIIEDPVPRDIPFEETKPSRQPDREREKIPA